MAQSHFIDLCRMLGEPAPLEADPTGEHYALEPRVEKADGGDGSADVWKGDFFAWEYKGPRKDLCASGWHRILTPGGLHARRPDHSPRRPG